MVGLGKTCLHRLFGAIIQAVLGAIQVFYIFGVIIAQIVTAFWPAILCGRGVMQPGLSHAVTRKCGLTVDTQARHSSIPSEISLARYREICYMHERFH